MTFSYTAVAFCLASIVVQSFGEIVVLRHPLSEHDSMRKLTCISEDDGSALIWNYNQKADASYNRPNVPGEFKPKSGVRKDIEKCAISNSTQCLVEWEVKKSGWRLTSSSVNPMGPVFDYRWENFPEFVFEEPIDHQKYRYVGKVSKSFGVAVFSVRGPNDIHIFLCVKKNPKNGPCFWIILAGWKGKKSVIKTCEKGGPPDEVTPSIGKCKDLAAVEHEAGRIINEYEWRTFTLKWISDTKTIQIFRETRRENELFLNGTVDHYQWDPVSHISTRCERESHVRFHFYEYLLTEKRNTVISTQKFNQDDENFCIEMLVGLCLECELKVYLVKEQRPDIEVGIVYGDEKSVHNGMLTWKLVKLSTTSEISNRKSITLEIRTILNGDGGRGQWAIGDIRTCKSVGSMRESTITIHPDKKSHPVLNCQKLSYYKSVSVDALSTKTINSDIIQTQKFISELIEFCGPSCTSFNEGWLLCNPIGCTCGRGFMGSNCTQKCYNGSYGYNCNANCTNCDYQTCDRFTGSCPARYPRSVSPSCVSSTEIEKPTVMNVTDTSVRILQQLKLEKDTVVSIQIHIRQKWGFKNTLVDLRESGMPSIYEACIPDLKPDTVYMALTVVTVKQEEKNTCRNGDDSTFTTTSSGQPLLLIEPEDTTITITMRNDTQDHPKDHQFALKIYDKKTLIGVIYDPRFPYTFGNLTPYTEYEVIKSDLSQPFITTIRTLNSGVRNLRVESQSDTEVTLRWDPPLHTNGSIRNYDISLKVNVLLGCNEIGKPTPPQNMTLRTVNDTTASITGLHPYAEYTATVIAYTTKPGKVKTTIFKTDEKRIPTSVVSNLRLDDGNLTLRWDTPDDCTTITGPRKATKLIFTGVSDSVRNWTNKRQTAYFKFHLLSNPASTFRLDPFTWYNVCVYVIRDFSLPENSTAYRTVRWRTPPDAPPAVTNLETFDANPENNTVSLRWTPPNPAKGEIEFYRVIITKKKQLFNNRTIKVSEEEPKCTLWVDYVCVEGLAVPPDIATIEVYAKNKGVTDLGIKNTVRIDSTLYKKAPSQPKNLTWTPQGHGIVKLKWSYPEITPTKINLFYIHINLISSNLSEYKTAKFSMTAKYPATKNLKDYTFTLYLSTSTVYNVSIVAANRLNFNSTEIKTKITVPRDVVLEGKEGQHLAWLAILPVLAICLLVLFIRYRKRNRIPKIPREPSYLEIIPSLPQSSSLNNLTALGDRRSSITQTGEAEIQVSANIYAIPNDPDSCPVSLDYFEEYAKGAAASGRLYSQFMLLPRGLTKPYDYGSLPENMPKNRCRNLIAYDRTRVVLEKIPGDCFSDYINASYIKGYHKERAYIAAQGPKRNTVNDFWRMIWQEDVRVICMLVNVVEGVRTMCEKYWPDFRTKVKYGELLISNVSNQVFADYTSRKFKISYQQDTREVTHLHYTGWPILGIPSSQSLVKYIKKLFQTPAGNGPVVVHCDTGDGRTGTVMLCDICMRQAIAENIIDVTAVITRMRDSRANMVGTPQQYLLAHIIISESLVSIPTQIPCNGILSKRIKEMRLQLPADLQRLNDTMWQEEALDSFATMQPVDELLLESVAVDNYAVSRTLERKSNQINAVSVDGLRTKNQYLASELPTPLTLHNFWKFIAEENIKLIIILQCSDPKSPTCCDILPDERISHSMPHIQIKTQASQNDGEYFTTEKLLLTDTSEENAITQSMTVLTCKGWEHGINRKPPTPTALVSLWRASEKIFREVGESIVLCHDGITGCGLYLALSYVLEGMAQDRECDVISAVRVVRRSIPGFVQSKEQCEYLYDAAETYAEYFQRYANFN